MTRDDFQIWRHSPAGKWFFETLLEEKIRDLAESIANGSCQNEDPGKVAMHYMDRVGCLSGMKFVQQLDPFEESNETEGNRPSPVNQDGR